MHSAFLCNLAISDYTCWHLLQQLQLLLLSGHSAMQYNMCSSELFANLPACTFEDNKQNYSCIVTADWQFDRVRSTLLVGASARL